MLTFLGKYFLGENCHFIVKLSYGNVGDNIRSKTVEGEKEREWRKRVREANSKTPNLGSVCR